MAKRPQNTTTATRPVTEAEGPRQLPCLEAVEGATHGALYALPRGTTTIGRDPTCTISLDGDGISRRHAKVVVDRDGSVQLIDLGSKNGTLANGESIEAKVLQPGSTVQLGANVTFRFRYFPEPEVQARSPGSQPLSVRELEVAQLVAAGLTNQEIGKRLFVSPRTVGTHITNIYKRLDVKTRAMITRWIIEHGLTKP